MITSRCGVRCDECERKEQVHCKGCTEMAKPFWGGNCEVKTCCEEQELQHCGMCSRFPCTTLTTMGADQGFDPAPKIAQCRIWANQHLTKG